MIPNYDPQVALEFFKSAGKPETIAQGATIFAEAEKGGLLKRPKAYLLLEGEVSLAAGGRLIGSAAKGDIFGEMAAISDSPRSATARAATACRVIALDDKQFKGALRKKPAFALMLMRMMVGRLRETIARLTAANALQGDALLKESRVFDPGQLVELVRGLADDPPVYYDRGKPIIQEGQTGIRMYVLLEGRVAVSVGGSIVERLGPGGVFGEIALVEPPQRLASVAAETDCSLLPVSRNAFLGLVKASPEFAIAVLTSLAARLRALTARLR